MTDASDQIGAGAGQWLRPDRMREARIAAEPLPQTTTAFLWRLVRLRPVGFGALFLLVVSAAACAVAVQYTMKLMVDGMAAPDRVATTVWAALGLFLGLIALESALWRGSGWLGSRTVVQSGVDLRLDLFRHLAGHNLGFFTSRLSGALGNRITGAAGNFGQLVGTGTWNIVPPCTDFVGALVIFSTIRWEMALALALCVLVLDGGLCLFALAGRRYHRRYAELANHAGGELVDTVANMWSVKAFSGVNRELARLRTVFGTEARAQRTSWMYLEKTRVLHDVALWLMASGMLVWAIHSWSRGLVTPGDVVVVSALTFRILHGSRDLVLAFISASQNVSFINETLREIGARHELADAPGARAFAGGSGTVAFEKVRFRYPDGQTVFEDFSLTIPTGQKVGIVGTSGAGKSTLLALVQRLHDVEAGRILIGGQPVAELTQDSLREAIAVVPQDVHLFHRSVLENIRYGRADATPEEVRAAARAALCDDFIAALPAGYDTIVGERGAKLSGGQRQRIAIARAILKDAPILLLDEATSALDSELELRVQHAISELGRYRTVIAVAHRLSTLTSYDRIIVLDGGRIVEDGPPEALLRAGGEFATLWRLQAGTMLPAESVAAE